MIASLQADNLACMTGLRHGFFTRQGGVSEGIYDSLNCGFSPQDKPENIIENRRRVAAHIGVAPNCLLSCAQVHSPNVVVAETAWGMDARPSADAMVTKQPGLALGILTADCVPILFADATTSVIGAAHAGWRGALTGVIENTLIAMEKLGARRGRIETALGACVWQKSYEVGPEFPAPFLAENPVHEKFFRPAFRSDHAMFDLPGYVVAKLRGLGVASVEPSPADTLADEERFFSYRRNSLRGDPRTGSLISVIVLKG
jgi:YfiH family protein